MLFQMDGRRGELGTKKKLFVDWGLGESQPVTPASAWNSRSRNIASSSRFVFSLGVCETLSNNRLHHRPIIMDSRQQTCIKSDGKWKKKTEDSSCVSSLPFPITFDSPSFSSFVHVVWFIPCMLRISLCTHNHLRLIRTQLAQWGKVEQREISPISL